MLNRRINIGMLLKAFKSKTVNFGLILVFFGFLELDKTIIPKLFPNGDHSVIYSIIGLIVVLLRYATSVPIKSK